MFTESEVENNMDFIPKIPNICRNCLHYEVCPYEYVCKTYGRYMRWMLGEDLDNDNSM